MARAKKKFSPRRKKRGGKKYARRRKSTRGFKRVECQLGRAALMYSRAKGYLSRVEKSAARGKAENPKGVRYLVTWKEKGETQWKKTVPLDRATAVRERNAIVDQGVGPTRLIRLTAKELKSWEKWPQMNPKGPSADQKARLMRGKTVLKTEYEKYFAPKLRKFGWVPGKSGQKFPALFGSVGYFLVLVPSASSVGSVMLYQNDRYVEPNPVDISMELGLARNMFGTLKPDVRKRLQAVVDHPSEKTWNNAYSIIVGSDGWMTLWQAVRAVDKTFTARGPASWKERGKWVREKWSTVPTRQLLLRALAYATH